MTPSKDLVAASAAPLVLSLLSRDESYGYEIIQSVRGLSGGRLAWTEGMLYPVLHRLELAGFIKGNWRAGPSGRQRRYYKLTAKGARQLERQKEDWLMVHASLTKLWSPGHA